MPGASPDPPPAPAPPERDAPGRSTELWQPTRSETHECRLLRHQEFFTTPPARLFLKCQLERAALRLLVWEEGGRKSLLVPPRGKEISRGLALPAKPPGGKWGTRTHLSSATFCSCRNSFFRLCSFSCCREALGTKPQEPSSAARCSRAARSSWCCLSSRFSSCQEQRVMPTVPPPADLGRGDEGDSPVPW